MTSFTMSEPSRTFRCGRELVKAMTGMDTRLRRAGILIAVGLLVQVASLLLSHPLAFVGFLAIGCPLVAAGIVLFLLGLVSGMPENNEAITASPGATKK